MTDLKIGQIVISKAGRDKGEWFVVLSICDDGQHVMLTNGRTRPIGRPKRKKIKHIQPTHNVDARLRQDILDKKNLTDADFRNAIKNAKS